MTCSHYFKLTPFLYARLFPNCKHCIQLLWNSLAYRKETVHLMQRMGLFITYLTIKLSILIYTVSIILSLFNMSVYPLLVYHR
jgi:hypothetical protein